MPASNAIVSRVTSPVRVIAFDTASSGVTGGTIGARALLVGVAAELSQTGDGGAVEGYFVTADIVVRDGSSADTKSLAKICLGFWIATTNIGFSWVSATTGLVRVSAVPTVDGP